MTLNEIVWRQVCSIKKKSDELVAILKAHPEIPASHMEIATQTAVIVCYASFADGDVSPMNVYDDIIAQVSCLQNTTWNIHKSCANTEFQDTTRKLYESCATLKKRLRKRLRALEQAELLASQAEQFFENAPEVTPVRCVATCT